MKGSYLGVEFSQQEIEKSLQSIGAIFETYEFNEVIEKHRFIYQKKR